MRIVRWSGLPAVVRVKTHMDVTVAIPEGVPRNDVLDLASLILSSGEYRQLWHAMTPGPPARTCHATEEAADLDGRWQLRS